MGSYLKKHPTKKHFFTLLPTLIEATNAVKQNKAKNTNLFNEVKDLAAIAKLPDIEIVHEIKHLDAYVKV